MKVSPIKEPEVRKALRLSFKEVRKDLDPLMNHLNFGDLQPMWWLKADGKQRTMGKCFNGHWKIHANGRRRYFKNLIILSRIYFENNGLEDVIGLWKHELVHLIAKDTHGPNFHRLAQCCGAKRHCPNINDKHHPDAE